MQIAPSSFSSYKVSATYLDGYKATCVAIIGGGRASAKGKATAEAILKRSRAIFGHLNMADFTDTYVCSIGSEDSFGKNARWVKLNQKVTLKSYLKCSTSTIRTNVAPRESTLWMSVQHEDKKALDIWAREIASSGTGMAPGMCQMVGGRPKASPCLKLFSFLYPKSLLPAKIQVDEDSCEYQVVPAGKVAF